MSISIEQIEHLAKLSKLALTPEEKQKYSQQLGSILTFLDTLTLEEKKKKILILIIQLTFSLKNKIIQILNHFCKTQNTLFCKILLQSKHHLLTKFSLLSSYYSKHGSVYRISHFYRDCSRTYC